VNPGAAKVSDGKDYDYYNGADFPGELIDGDTKNYLQLNIEIRRLLNLN
jgi:hypothetical protein